MSASLALDVAPGTSALERLLSVVRRRGFHIDALQAVRASHDHGALSVELEVSGERSVEVLSRHLQNLSDCQRVRITGRDFEGARARRAS
ncbi:MAG: ACT domain-containing protein [Acidobacteriota bacterium]